MFPGRGSAQAGAGAMAERLRDIEAVTDAALSRLDDRALLQTLLDRVKRTLQADTAVVLILESGQLVATAANGLEVEVLQGVRVPVGVGFSGRVAQTREPVILTDVNEQTVMSSALTERGVKALLGVPLFAGGEVIGVLHVGSLTERQFTAEDVEVLQLAGNRAALALRSMIARADAKSAIALHRSLLPAALPDPPGTDLATRYVTGSGNVGGDWYDVFSLPDGHVGIVVGDVTGSGMQAALIMGRMRSALRAYVLEVDDPALVLRMLDRNLQYFEPNAMATIFYGRYLPKTGELVASSAGHLQPVLAVPGGPPAAPVPIEPDPPIGVADDLPRRSASVTLPPGAVMCCFTDGLVERRGESIEVGIGAVAATLDRLVARRVSRARRPVSLAEDAVSAVMGELIGNAPAQDDVAVLVVHRCPV